MNKLTQTFGNNAKERTVSALANTVDAVRKPYPPFCRKCLGGGFIYGFATNDPSEKEKTMECPRCKGEGYEPEWKPNEDMLDEGEDAWMSVHDMDTTAKSYCEAILIACRPLIIAEYKESKNVFDK